MNYTQLVTPNPEGKWNYYVWQENKWYYNIGCLPGWCLAYVENALGTSHLYKNATEAREASQHFHTDLPPLGICVPLHFSMDDVPDGHIALWMSDGTVYSTTNQSTTPVHHKSLDDLIATYKKCYPTFTYLGWSEDLATIRIVKENSDMITKEDVSIVRIINSEVEGYPLEDTHAGKFDEQEMAAWVGKDFRDFIWSRWINGEGYRASKAEAFARPETVIKEVVKEVPVEVIKEVIKEVPVDKIVTVNKEIRVGIEEFSAGQLFSAMIKKLFTK